MAVFKWRGISYKNFFEEKDNYISGRYYKTGEFVIKDFKVIITNFQDFWSNWFRFTIWSQIVQKCKKTAQWWAYGQPS